MRLETGHGTRPRIVTDSDSGGRTRHGAGTGVDQGTGCNVSGELGRMLGVVVDAYVERLGRAVYAVVLKEVKTNLRNDIPLCYQSQVDHETLVYMAYSLTTLVPEFYLKWWRRVYMPFIQQGIEEIFLKNL